MNKANAKKEKSGISPASFFSSDVEKTKINWFCFEYAMEIQNHIGKPLRNRLLKAGVTENDIALFCIHYSKTMKKQILRQVAGKQKKIHLEYNSIEDFFPTMHDKLVDNLLTAVATAWDKLTEVCVICPVRCISEKDCLAVMFDDPDYYD